MELEQRQNVEWRKASKYSVNQGKLEAGCLFFKKDSSSVCEISFKALGVGLATWRGKEVGRAGGGPAGGQVCGERVSAGEELIPQ